MQANHPIQLPVIDDENDSFASGKKPAAKTEMNVKERLLVAEGGYYLSQEAAKVLQVTEQQITELRQSNKIIGLPVQDGRYVYPKWQFVKKFLWRHQILPSLDEVLSEFPVSDPWVQAAFMLNDSTPAGFKTPLSGLKNRKVSQVLSLARCFGEHGAG
jgi:hypothetical protein